MANRIPLVHVEDHEDFICVFKRQGLKSCALEHGKIGLLEILQLQMKQKLFLVHHLDTEASGLMVFAKTAEASHKLKETFKTDGSLEKILSQTDKGQRQIKIKSLNQNSKSLSQKSISNLFDQAAEIRKQMFGEISAQQCFRLVHVENLKLRADKLGEVLWVYWYYEEPATEEQISEIANWCAKNQLKPIIVKMNNRGASPNDTNIWNPLQASSHWQAMENHLRFEFRQDTGLSAGLFLDQRENRLWVAENAKGKTVLNLFSYTGGFSVAAAVSEATAVTTVDVSVKFLDWAKRNFKLNLVDANLKKYEFFAADVLLFLKGTIKRHRKFDLVICDPPSMGRSKEGVFSIKKDWKGLIEKLIQVTASRGLILFSTNFEGWTAAELTEMIRLAFGHQVEILKTPIAGLDYESPSEEPLMKSLILRLKD